MWTMEEALQYYRTQGAPSDQNALIALLREIQQHSGGSLNILQLEQIASGYGIRVSLLQALVKRIPSLRLGDTPCLELCAGPNCGKHTDLAAFAEDLCAKKGIPLKFVPCMRLCGKGPNLRWQGQIYHKADRALLRSLLEK